MEINLYWTEELLALMFRKRNERIARLNETRERPTHNRVSNEEFFARHAGKIKVVKHAPRNPSR